MTIHNLQTAILALLTVAVVSGCNASGNNPSELETIIAEQFVPVDKFLSITNGTPLAEARLRLGPAVRHMFTASLNGHDWTLIRCFIDTVKNDQGYMYYSLLFRDESLLKTIGWIRMEQEEYPYRGTTATRKKPWGIGDTKYIEKAIEAPAVKPEHIRAKVDSAIQHSKSRKGSGNIPAFIGHIIAPAFRAKAITGYPINKRLRAKFDGCRISLGTRIEKVDELYGNPLHTFTTKEGTVRIYGDNVDLGNAVDSPLLFSYVAVAFDHAGQVTGVFSDGYFCNEWYPNMPAWRQ